MQTSLICLAVSMIGGLMLSRLTKKLNLPAVTAYLVAGLLLGPFLLGTIGVSGLGFNSLEQLEGFSVVTQTALGFIAFTIGNEFRLSQLRAIVIGILQAVIATLPGGTLTRNVVLFAVLIYELVGPALTKRSLLAVGEIRPEGRTSARKHNQPK